MTISTGIPGIDNVPWGTHFCHFYQDESDLLDAVIPFIKTGIEDHESCLWIVADELSQEAREKIEHVIPDFEERRSKNDIEIISNSRRHLEDNSFLPQRAINFIDEKYAQALARGHTGLRVITDHSWLDKKYWDKDPGNSIVGQHIILLCTCPLAAGQVSNLFDIWRSPQLISVKQNGKWDLYETVTGALKHKSTEILRRDEKDQLPHLWFLESLDQVNRIMQGVNDLEQMLSRVLDVLLSIFDCDRAWFVYPCDPDASTWQVPMERTRPEYPGVLPIGVELPLDPAGAAVYRILLNTSNPVQFGPGSKYPVPIEMAQGFSVQSFLAMAFYPKASKPWALGLHQCSYPRIWTSQEERLFLEISRRLADGLTSLLMVRDLQESELRYRELFAYTSDAIVITEITGTGRFILLDFNAAWEKIIGFSRNELAGKFLDDIGFYNTAYTILDQLHTCSEKKIPVDFEQELGTPTGHWYIHTTLFPVSDATGKIYRIVAIHHDISEHKQAEETQRRLNRELRAISNCNQTLLRANDEQTLLNDVCRIICSEAGYHMAWVGYVGDDAARSVIPMAISGIDDGYIANAKISWSDETEYGRGPAGKAIRSGEIVYIQDLVTDSQMAPWRESALQRGYRSTISLPLKDENSKVFGGLFIYSSEPYAITDDEIRLLGELADDLAFGIITLRSRVERKRAEEALREREQHAQSLSHLSRQLEQAHSYDEVIRVSFAEIRKIIGYQNLWVYRLSEDNQFFHALAAVGPMSKTIMSVEGGAALAITGDRMLEEIAAKNEIVIIEDALIDERTNMEQVARFGNRTIVNVPIVLFDRHLGSVGTGTFGDEGVRIPTRSQQEYLTMLANHLAVSLDRLHSMAEREKTIIQLKESEERFSTVFHFSPIAICIIRARDEVFVDVNDAFEKLSGYQRDEIIGHTLAQIDLWVNPIQQKPIMGKISTDSMTGGVEVQARTKSGAMITGLTSTAEITLGGEKHYLTLTHDITELKRSQRLDLLQTTALIAAANAIVLTDRQGVILWVNPAFSKLTGYTREEAIGQTPRIVKSNQHDLAFYRNLWDTILSGGVWQGEVINRRKDGSLYTEEMLITPVRQADGEITHFIAIKQDVSERKQHEKEREVIIHISNVLRAARTRAEMLPILLDQVNQMFQAKSTAVTMIDPIADKLVIELGCGIFDKKLTGKILAPGEGFSGQVIANGVPCLCNNIKNDPSFIELELMDDVNALACAPLIAQEHTIGALWFTRSGEINQEELGLLVGIADIAANAIRRTTLHEQTEQQLRRLSALHQIDTAISSSLDLHTTLNVLLNIVLNLLGGDAANILLLNPHSHDLEYAAGLGFYTQNIEHSRVHLGQGQAGTAALERRVVSFPDMHQAKIAFKLSTLLADENFVSHFVAPLVAKGQIKGVLEVFHRSWVDPLPEWFNFFETLATQAAIAIDNATLFDNLQNSNAELKLAYDATIEGWSRALDLRDKETEGHTRRVAEMSLRLAEALGIRDEELTHIRRGALLHDIGKMGIPDKILLKEGPLTPEELAIMNRHSTYAYDLLFPIAFLRPALEIPYSHHEKWDGSGYPVGMKGEQIPISARLFAIVDVWDALTATRPYRAAWPKEKARAYILEQAGKHFDPQIVELFFQILDESEPER